MWQTDGQTDGQNCDSNSGRLMAVHTADANETKLSCLIRVSGVNKPQARALKTERIVKPDHVTHRPWSNHTSLLSVCVKASAGHFEHCFWLKHRASSHFVVVADYKISCELTSLSVFFHLIHVDMILQCNTLANTVATFDYLAKYKENANSYDKWWHYGINRSVRVHLYSL